MFQKLLGLARRTTFQAAAIVCSHSPLILMTFDLSGCTSGPRRSARERLNRVHPELLQNNTTIILAEGMVNRSISLSWSSAAVCCGHAPWAATNHQKALCSAPQTCWSEFALVLRWNCSCVGTSCRRSALSAADCHGDDHALPRPEVSGMRSSTVVSQRFYLVVSGGFLG